MSAALLHADPEPEPLRRWSIDLLLDDRAWLTRLPGALPLVRRAAWLTLSNQGAGPGGVTIVLADDPLLRKLNAAFRGRDRTTNVLSFPEDEAGSSFGEIVVARRQLCREARAQSKRPLAHLAHLVVHGLLHLFGHDHEARAEAERMEWRERKLLSALAFADPYARPAKPAKQALA
ncbi:MAG: rRNA maturation RNase YbeY [Pseudomonadota bacterium]